MKKAGLIMLLVLFLSVSMTVTAENLDGFTNSLETIPTQTIVENQAVSAPIFGGVAVLSVNLSEQVAVENIAVSASAYIGLEMETLITGLQIMSSVNYIDGSRGDYLHYAGMY